MRATNHRRLIHRDCWSFSGRPLTSGRIRCTVRGTNGQEKRTPPLRGDALLPVGQPPAEPPDHYGGRGRGPGFDGPTDYGGRLPGLGGTAGYTGCEPGFDGTTLYGKTKL
uniref:Uncharacterized protein n=1 Tax=Branchiostoma floridae TaxID=7739 RepID=C3YR97_BRAFL|eukprot:XP_002601082.1 hypothetical protein BRAFLDRAFT_75517 [Branchiostoma floridae]